MNICEVCERTIEPERDAFGSTLPLCLCPEPTPLDRIFDPVTQRLVDEPKTPREETLT